MLLENCPHFFDTLPLLVWADVKKKKNYQNGDIRNRVVITYSNTVPERLFN